jgi:hypothetical protein
VQQEFWSNERRLLDKQVNERMMTNNQPTTRKSVHKSWYGIIKHRRLTFNLYIWLLLGVQLMVNKIKLYLQDISNPSVRQKHRHHCHASRSRSPAIDDRLQDFVMPMSKYTWSEILRKFQYTAWHNKDNKLILINSQLEWRS